MRKALAFLVLLLTCAACSDASESTTNNDDGALNGSIGSASGEGGGEAEEGSSGAATDPASVTAPSPLPPSVSGPGGAGGAMAGGVPGGAARDASSGASFGGGGAAPAGGAVAIGPTSPTAPVAPIMPVFTSAMPTPQGGQLTAGAWDDNLNYTRFAQFREDVQQTRPNGVLPFTSAEFDAAYEKFSKPRAAHQLLDVALVIDTTGSMGDEIAYLQREFSDLSSAIESAYPEADQRWALIVYRDVGDIYVTREFDFRSDLNALRADLAAQSAGGGGDFPEAPDAAFEQLTQFQWRSGDEVAKLAFWVADAPHHGHRATAMADALRAAQQQNIHIYPVASSGIDEFTELTMRSSAQLTGGRYLFLTNDSGIGGSHKEPSIPCYFVTRLDHAILRMIKIEMTGMHSEPEEEQILRTGGDPQDGACTLSSGMEVEVF